jgi:hypothetical protein
VGFARGGWVGTFIFDAKPKKSQFGGGEKWFDGGGGKGIS